MSWTLLPVSMGQGGISSIAINPFVPSTLYVGGPNGVGKSLNGGLSWQAAVAGLTTLAVTTIATEPVQADTLYAGTNGGGVYKSTNGGASWFAYSDGLGVGRVSALAIPATALPRLYAATDGGGVFRRTRRRRRSTMI